MIFLSILLGIPHREWNVLWFCQIFFTEKKTYKLIAPPPPQKYK